MISYFCDQRDKIVQVSSNKYRMTYMEILSALTNFFTLGKYNRCLNKFNLFNLIRPNLSLYFMLNDRSFGNSFELNENQPNGFKWKHSFPYFWRTKHRFPYFWRAKHSFPCFWRTKHTLHVKCTSEKGKINYFQKSCRIL